MMRNITLNDLEIKQLLTILNNYGIDFKNKNCEGYKNTIKLYEEIRNQTGVYLS